MSLLGFGQPLTGVFQMCYLVEDIEASMRRWVQQLNVGPWFLLEHFTGISDPYEDPPAPDITVDSSIETVEQSTARILTHILNIGKPPDDPTKIDTCSASM